MLYNIIYLYEYIKELLEYVNGSVDQPVKNEISAILDAEEAERNDQTIEDGISEEVIEKFRSKQLSQIAIEHDYVKCSVDGNNNMLSCNNIIHAPAVKVEPRSEVYGLREIKKIKGESCICYNS